MIQNIGFSENSFNESTINPHLEFMSFPVLSKFSAQSTTLKTGDSALWKAILNPDVFHSGQWES